MKAFLGGFAGFRVVAVFCWVLCASFAIGFNAAAAAPVNDNFADRTLITAAHAPISGSTLEATHESGEPAGQLKTVWYSWAAPEGESFALVMEDATFVVNARLYTGDSLGTLQMAGLPALYSGGQLYHIQLGGQSGSSGDYRFTIRTAESPGAPIIVREPDSRAATLGTSNFFSVNIRGQNLQNLAFQWFKDGTPMTGATNSLLGFGEVQAEHAGEYFLQVSNSFGSATTRVARLTVHPPLYVQTLHVRDTNGTLQRFDAWGISVASNNVIYIAGDNGVREIAPTGQTEGIPAPIADGDMMTYVRASNTVYFTEGVRGRIHKIEDSRITTIVGGSLTGYFDGPIATARFSILRGIVVANDGAMYVADAGNNVIRKIQDGAVSTYAGRAPVMGARDGIAAEATFGFPAGLALDASGNLFVADDMNHVIRKISTNGIVGTFAGMPGISGTVDGQGINARFDKPGGLVMDQSGNLIVTELGSRRIRLVTPDAVVLTLSENGRLFAPYGIAIDETGNFVFADFLRRAVWRAFWWDGTTPPILTASHAVTRAPAGSNIELSADLRGTEPISLQWYRNNVAVLGATGATLPIVNLSANHSGTYYLSASNTFGVTTTSNLLVRVSIPVAWAAPVLNGAGILLTFGTADGSVPPAGSLTNLQVQGSANLADWQTFETVPFLTNGQHRFPMSVTEPYRFFRVLEP